MIKGKFGDYMLCGDCGYFYKQEDLKPCPFCGAEAELIEFYIAGSANTKHFFVR